MPDEIIEELWGIKDRIAREHGNDVRKLAAYLQSKKDAKHARMTDLGGGTKERQQRDIENARDLARVQASQAAGGVKDATHP